MSKLIDAGMNVARLNFSHGSYEEHARMIHDIRRIAEEKGVVVALLQDLQGPKIRVGELPKSGVDLKAGEEVWFSTREVVLPEIRVQCPDFEQFVEVGMEMLLDDGNISVEISKVDKEGGRVAGIVRNGGVLTSHKGLAVRGANFTVPALTEKDLRDLEFGLSMGIDAVALSFVRGSADLENLCGAIATYNVMHGLSHVPQVVAKIERHEALMVMGEILAVTDVVMVARGDLGLDIPIEKLPIVQKELIAKCREVYVPVVVATQMMESMILHAMPTRAEVSDVANAVIDHADAVMLSGETANGSHPVEVVEVMSRVVREAEESVFDNTVLTDGLRERLGGAELFGGLVKAVAGGVRAVVITSATMEIVRRVAALRLEVDVYAVAGSHEEAAAYQSVWGIQPVMGGVSGLGGKVVYVDAVKREMKIEGA